MTTWPTRAMSSSRSRKPCRTKRRRPAPPPRNKEKRRRMAIETRKMRKFLNDPTQVVKESLAGLAAAHPDLIRYDAAAQIIVRRDAPKKGKVALISGGGSGHEPLHGGVCGLGLVGAAFPRAG